MAIAACPDCNKDVSDSAPACPNCGRPNPALARREPVFATQKQSPTVRPVGLWLALGILVLPIVFVWFTLGKGRTAKARVLAFGYLILSIALVSMQGSSSSNSYSSSSSTTSSAVSAPAPAKEQVIQVGISQILSDYKGNEVSADNKYKDRLIQVTGSVGEIKKDITNSLYVTLGTGATFELPTVQAFFDDSMNEQLSNLRKGQKLTVICRVDGLMMNVIAKDCFIK